MVDTLNTGATFATSSVTTVAADANGTLVLVYSGSLAVGANGHVYVRRSTDSGVTWSARAEMTTSASGADATSVAAAGKGNGLFTLTWMDKRTGAWNVWERGSTDGGQTWSADARVSDATSGAPTRRPAGSVPLRRLRHRGPHLREQDGRRDGRGRYEPDQRRHLGQPPDLTGGDEMRRRAAVLGVIGLVLLWPVRAMAGPSAAPNRQAAPAPSGFANEALWSSNDDWEPNVATAPGSPFVYELTTRYSKFCASGQGHCMAFRASSDGGATWGADQLICPCKAAQNDPVMKVATDGTIYQVHMNGYAVVFQKSSDHGATWSAPIDFKALSGLSFTDKPWIAISPTGQDVYVAFNAADSYISSSHNFGASFSAPIKTNSDALYWFAEGGAVAPNGNVYFSESAEQNAKSPTGPIQLAAISSTNGGASWSTTIVDTSQQQPPCPARSCPADFYGAQAALAVDAGGTAMLAYVKSTSAAAPMSLYERTSTNGVTWSAPWRWAAEGPRWAPTSRRSPPGRRAATFAWAGWTTVTAAPLSTCGIAARRTAGGPGDPACASRTSGRARPTRRQTGSPFRTGTTSRWR